MAVVLALVVLVALHLAEIAHRPRTSGAARQRKRPLQAWASTSPPTNASSLSCPPRWLGWPGALRALPQLYRPGLLRFPFPCSSWSWSSCVGAVASGKLGSPGLFSSSALPEACAGRRHRHPGLRGHIGAHHHVSTGRTGRRPQTAGPQTAPRRGGPCRLMRRPAPRTDVSGATVRWWHPRPDRSRFHHRQRFGHSASLAPTAQGKTAMLNAITGMVPWLAGPYLDGAEHRRPAAARNAPQPAWCAHLPESSESSPPCRCWKTS